MDSCCPCRTDQLYVATGSFEVQGTTGVDNTVTWSTPVAISRDGTNGMDGDDGRSVYLATIYQRTSTAPATPTGGSFNFGANTLTPPTGWSNGVPTNNGDPVYVSTGLFSIQGDTGVDTTVTWADPVILAEDGAAGSNGVDGTNGRTTAYLTVYQRNASQPTAPTGGSFDFGTNTLTPPVDWSVNVPVGSQIVWQSSTLASVVGNTGTDTTLTWSQPSEIFRNGETGPRGIQGEAGLSILKPRFISGLQQLQRHLRVVHIISPLKC